MPGTLFLPVGVPGVSVKPRRRRSGIIESWERARAIPARSMPRTRRSSHIRGGRGRRVRSLADLAGRIRVPSPAIGHAVPASIVAIAEQRSGVLGGPSSGFGGGVASWWRGFANAGTPATGTTATTPTRPAPIASPDVGPFESDDVPDVGHEFGVTTPDAETSLPEGCESIDGQLLCETRRGHPLQDIQPWESAKDCVLRFGKLLCPPGTTLSVPGSAIDDPDAETDLPADEPVSDEPAPLSLDSRALWIGAGVVALLMFRKRKRRRTRRRR